jgi:hypothetical protein
MDATLAIALRDGSWMRVPPRLVADAQSADGGATHAASGWNHICAKQRCSASTVVRQLGAAQDGQSRGSGASILSGAACDAK